MAKCETLRGIYATGKNRIKDTGAYVLVAFTANRVPRV
jgi:hypothetical protein